MHSICIPQITDAADTDEAPIEIPEDVACSTSGGMCQTTVTLTLDVVSAGRLYFVSVRARNRYGESQATGSSAFRIGPFSATTEVSGIPTGSVSLCWAMS